MQTIKDEAIANGTFMKAPNGKPTNLNERQWLQVRTTAFKNWFGDWINNPSEASKVVDENGEPLVVYHGDSDIDITNWKVKMRDTITGYFTANKEKAKLYADDGKIYGAFLNIRNPFDWYKDIKKSQELLGLDWSYIDKHLAEDAIAEGYDGISISKHYNSYLAISSPNQIKSATDNTGEFSTTNNDIRYSSVNDNIDTTTINLTQTQSPQVFKDNLSLENQAKFASLMAEDEFIISCR